MKIKVLLACTPSYLKTLSEKLRKENSIDIAAETDTLGNLFSLMETHRPEILVLDFGMDRFRDSKNIGEFMKEFSEKVKIVGVFENGDINIISNFIQEGGYGYAQKTCHYEEVFGAVRSVHEGNLFLCPHIFGKFLNEVSDFAPPLDSKLVEKLTKTELEICRLIRKGAEPKEIASKSFKSVSTIRTHINNILRKLDIHSCFELQRRLILTKLD
ncbi:MAG: response regulator transcription factor [Candidatus Latescibacterota bacterium]